MARCVLKSDMRYGERGLYRARPTTGPHALDTHARGHTPLRPRQSPPDPNPPSSSPAPAGANSRSKSSSSSSSTSSLGRPQFTWPRGWMTPCLRRVEGHQPSPAQPRHARTHPCSRPATSPPSAAHAQSARTHVCTSSPARYASSVGSMSVSVPPPSSSSSSSSPPPSSGSAAKPSVRARARRNAVCGYCCARRASAASRSRQRGSPCAQTQTQKQSAAQRGSA